jgi:hypothetical protein
VPKSLIKRQEQVPSEQARWLVRLTQRRPAHRRSWGRGGQRRTLDDLPLVARSNT